MRALFFILAAFGFTAYADCAEYAAGARLVARTRDGHTAFWNLRAANDLLQAAGNWNEDVEAHRQWVGKHTSWTGREGLRNLLSIYENSSLKSDPAFQVSTANLRAVMTGRVGRIRAMNCLESIVFAEFLKVHDLRRAPAEAFALVLRKGDEIAILGDFYARPMAEGSGPSRASLKEARRLRKLGWRVWINLHNHPYDFSNEYGDIGGNLAPSEPDIATYHRDRPELAIVTNGLESVQLSVQDYLKLNLF